MEQSHILIAPGAPDQTRSFAGRVALLDFDPVRVRPRKDGWTPERQRAFIAALAATRCVLKACRHVGLSSESAYKLYRRSDAVSFRRAWDAALAGLKPQGSSTSEGRTDADGNCRVRRRHQLPDRQLSDPAAAASPPAIRPYSLEAFTRLARARKKDSLRP